MTNIEHMELKNELVFRVTKKILIPPEQMMLEPYVELYPDEYLVQDNCPYCSARVKAKSLDCANCPMELADNGCINNTSSSWVIANDIWSKVANEDDRIELYDLVVRYNKENEDD